MEDEMFILKKATLLAGMVFFAIQLNASMFSKLGDNATEKVNEYIAKWLGDHQKVVHRMAMVKIGATFSTLKTAVEKDSKVFDIPSLKRSYESLKECAEEHPNKFMSQIAKEFGTQVQKAAAGMSKYGDAGASKRELSVLYQSFNTLAEQTGKKARSK